MDEFGNASGYRQVAGGDLLGGQEGSGQPRGRSRSGERVHEIEQADVSLLPGDVSVGEKPVNALGDRKRVVRWRLRVDLRHAGNLHG